MSHYLRQAATIYCMICVSLDITFVILSVLFFQHYRIVSGRVRLQPRTTRLSS